LHPQRFFKDSVEFRIHAKKGRVVYAAKGSGIRAELAKQESLNGFMQQGHPELDLY